jgi:hypothetical protein
MSLDGEPGSIPRLFQLGLGAATRHYFSRPTEIIATLSLNCSTSTLLVRPLRMRPILMPPCMLVAGRLLMYVVNRHYHIKRKLQPYTRAKSYEAIKPHSESWAPCTVRFPKAQLYEPSRDSLFHNNRLQQLK